MKKPVCPQCGSKQVLYRAKPGEHWCRVCGWHGEAKWIDPDPTTDRP